MSWIVVVAGMALVAAAVILRAPEHASRCRDGPTPATTVSCQSRQMGRAGERDRFSRVDTVETVLRTVLLRIV